MCPSNKCGPLCLKTNTNCTGESNYDSSILLPKEDETLFNFNGPESPLCPDNCCKEGNEYCFRTHDNTGNEIKEDQEMMLVFGGVSELDVKIGDKKVLEDCENIDSIKFYFIKIFLFSIKFIYK